MSCSCDGFILSVTWSHAIVDGAGMGQFLQAIGELSQGLPRPSVVLVRLAKAPAAIIPQVVSSHNASREFAQ
jgi:hypothetical protein